MALSPHKSHLLIFPFFFLLIHAKLDLHPSDLKALTTVLKHIGLGVNGQLHPCNTEGVFCERRLSNNESYVLRVTRLIFNSKNLNGVLSPAIGNLSELKELSFSNNQLVDQIPFHIVDCRKLEILDLRNNQLSGNVPPELSSLIRLRILDISSNKLSGNLNFLKYFPNLESLSVAENLFTGKIPSSIRSFRNLRHFNYSGNRFLEGSVPLVRLEGSGSASESDVIPKRFILSETPAERMKRYTAPAPALKPSKSNGPAQAPAPTRATHKHKHKSSKRKLAGWIVGFVAGALGGILCGLIFSLLFKLAMAVIKGGRKTSGPAIFSPLIKRAEDLAFLEKEDGLASLEIIGSGGCGEVYKAELPGSNGKMIAIKKIAQQLQRDAAELAEEASKLLSKKMRQIRSEINTVGQIRHRNLLPLLAHMSKPDCHYLVYEYMKNGSLQGKLPSDDFFLQTDEMSLVKWMRNVMASENPKRAIDTKLIGNGYEEQMLLVLRIACFCTLDDPKERPNSKDVRCMLAQINH
ncbi:Protein kinase domain [Sesbania bispinosa]|nr:Protein kinase domain [Sesbania bispinosa]